MRPAIARVRRGEPTLPAKTWPHIAIEPGFGARRPTAASFVRPEDKHIHRTRAQTTDANWTTIAKDLTTEPSQIPCRQAQTRYDLESLKPCASGVTFKQGRACDQNHADIEQAKGEGTRRATQRAPHPATTLRRLATPIARENAIAAAWPAHRLPWNFHRGR